MNTNNTLELGDPLIIPDRGIAQFIADLALKHHVAVRATEIDKLANSITTLSGDDVREDELIRLIRALRHEGVLNESNHMSILSKYLNEKQMNLINDNKKTLILFECLECRLVLDKRISDKALEGRKVECPACGCSGFEKVSYDPDNVVPPE